MATASKRRGRTATFQPGQSGNPNGRPPGSRNKVTLAVEALLDGEAEMLTRKAIERAKEGDMSALRLCMDRIAPARKDRPVSFALPKLTKSSDAVAAAAAIAEAVAAGDLTPSEAAELAKLVDAFARAIEVHDLNERVGRLEARGAGHDASE
jgi:hypothetical protein